MQSNALASLRNWLSDIKSPEDLVKMLQDAHSSYKPSMTNPAYRLRRQIQNLADVGLGLRLGLDNGGELVVGALYRWNDKGVWVKFSSDKLEFFDYAAIQRFELEDKLE